MNILISQIETLFQEGLQISSVYLEPESGGKYVAVIGVANWLPLGEGGDLPRHKVSVDTDNLPAGISVSGGERHPDERIDLGTMNDEQAEALIRDIARIGNAMDVASFARPGQHGQAWLTKPRKWGVQ